MVYGISVAGSVVVTVALTTARVVLVASGHNAPPELVAAFSVAVTSTLGLLAAGRVVRQ